MVNFSETWYYPGDVVTCSLLAFSLGKQTNKKGKYQMPSKMFMVQYRPKVKKCIISLWQVNANIDHIAELYVIMCRIEVATNPLFYSCCTNVALQE